MHQSHQTHHGRYNNVHSGPKSNLQYLHQKNASHTPSTQNNNLSTSMLASHGIAASAAHHSQQQQPSQSPSTQIQKENMHNKNNNNTQSTTSKQQSQIVQVPSHRDEQQKLPSQSHHSKPNILINNKNLNSTESGHLQTTATKTNVGTAVMNAAPTSQVQPVRPQSPIIEVSAKNDQLPTATILNETLTNGTKEKTPMCLVNELARFNKVTHQYRLTGEHGPAHKKRFTVTLKLGEEEYTSEGASIKKAQHSAASEACGKTKYKHPPAKTNRLKTNSRAPAGTGHITPTVELNALAMKRGEMTVYNFDPPASASQAFPPQMGHDANQFPFGATSAGGMANQMNSGRNYRKGGDRINTTMSSTTAPPYAGGRQRFGQPSRYYGQMNHSISKNDKVIVFFFFYESDCR